MRIAPQILVKAENESYLAQFDLSALLATGETIASATVTALPATLTIGTPGCSGAIVQVRISGGTGDDVYALTCVALTSMGNTLSGIGELIVDDV
jgi:hypothetical protein